MFDFHLDATEGLARAGRLVLPHGVLETPAFMPVGTHGAVRGLHPEEVLKAGAQIILGNTYHLHLRPGEEVVHALGGLHRFTTWARPMLTDSGGFQVFSLEGLRKIAEDGVEFVSHIDGSTHHLTPESAMEIQWALGADIAMAFDHVVPGQAPLALAEEGMERTLRWLDRCRKRHDELAVSRRAIGRYRATAADSLAHPPGRHPRRAPAPVAGGHPRARSVDRDRHRRALGGRAQAGDAPGAGGARPRPPDFDAPLSYGRGISGRSARGDRPRRRSVRLRGRDPQRPPRQRLDQHGQGEHPRSRSSDSARNRSTRRATARPAPGFPAPTFGTCSWPRRCSGSGWSRSTTSGS